jgi:hypothetical protein
MRIRAAPTRQFSFFFLEKLCFKYEKKIFSFRRRVINRKTKRCQQVNKAYDDFLRQLKKMRLGSTPA